MEAVFLRQRGNLFPPEPHQKGFYHPSRQKNLSKNEKQTCMSPARPRPPAASDPAAPHMGTQWNMVHVPVKNVSGDSSSSQFNESWPSSSELVGPSPVGESGGGQGDTLATYIHRFRHAPATCRAVREKPRETFWWKLGPTAHEQHVTPPRQPQDHSTPTSSGKKSVSVTPRVSSNGNDSMDERTQSLIDKSSSLLTTSTSSSLPAQKYLNTRDQRTPMQPDDNDPRSAKPHPPSLMRPLRELPLNPEEDILYQWRLQRRLEEARKEAAMAEEEGGVFEQRRKNGRWQGEMGPHMHSPHFVTAAQNQSCYSGAEFDATTRAQPTQQPHGISQWPNVCTCTQSLHKIGPPASHHPHLHLSHTHIPPHKHTLCDIVHCPCCSTAGKSHLVEGMPGNQSPECLDLSGLELQGQSPGVKFTQVEPPIVQEDPPRLELVHRQSPEAKSAQVEPTGVQGGTSVHVNETPVDVRRSRAEATAGEVPAERSVQCAKEEDTRGKRDTRTETKVARVSESTTQHGRDELPLAGRGGRRQGRPPVQYPSSPVLVRHTSREPSQHQTTPSDSESGDEGSQLSLTFSSEFECTLTPRSTAPQTRTEHSETSTPNIRPVLSQAIREHLFGSQPSTPPPTAITTHTPSSPPPAAITTHTPSSPPPTAITTSSPPPAAITTHTPSSSPATTVTTHTSSSPPPTAITTHTPSSPPLTTHGSPQRGTPTSKEPLSADVSDSVSWDIPWDDNMGDELLKVLIDKAKLFEAQIWEIDRLLSITSGD